MNGFFFPLQLVIAFGQEPNRPGLDKNLQYLLFLVQDRSSSLDRTCYC